MLTILRTQPIGSVITTFLDASVTLRKGKDNVEGCGDITFSMKTYEKIARDNEGNIGDHILLPINLFFETLTFDEQKDIYDLYAYSRSIMATMNRDNRREVQDALQERIFNTARRLNLSEKMIAFCKTDRFVYPDLSTVGTLPHHSPAKTFLLQDYVEITAISLLSKMMVPIWGEFIKELADMDVSNHQRENIAFELIEVTLESGAFERIYGKLYNTLSTLIQERRKMMDKKAIPSGVTSSYIITHNGIDDQMFESIVMATIVVKRMATYECFTRLRDGNVPNAMVYIDDGIKRTADTRIQSMRRDMSSLPRRELPAHDTEDNSSILDHASRISKKPIDVPIFVQTAVTNWELPKMVVELDTPEDVFASACDYYLTNSFDISPLCQAMIASFIGTRFGGSKCIGYLPPRVYQQLVVLLQIFLIRQEMYDLASLITAKTSTTPIEGSSTSLATRIHTNLKSSEYLQCQTLFKGFLEKPVNDFVKKSTGRKPEVDRIDFVSQINRMVEWLTRYTHSENMAPALWEFSKQENRPIVGSECRYDENTIRNLCRFYLIFHGGSRPF